MKISPSLFVRVGFSGSLAIHSFEIKKRTDSKRLRERSPVFGLGRDSKANERHVHEGASELAPMRPAAFLVPVMSL